MCHRRSLHKCIDLESKLVKHSDLNLKNDVETGSKTDIDNLLEFLQDEVEAEEWISFASKSFEKNLSIQSCTQ